MITAKNARKKSEEFHEKSLRESLEPVLATISNAIESEAQRGGFEIERVMTKALSEELLALLRGELSKHGYVTTLEEGKEPGFPILRVSWREER